MQWLHHMHEFVSFNQAVHLKYRIWKSICLKCPGCALLMFLKGYTGYPGLYSHIIQFYRYNYTITAKKYMNVTALFNKISNKWYFEKQAEMCRWKVVYLSVLSLVVLYYPSLCIQYFKCDLNISTNLFNWLGESE